MKIKKSLLYIILFFPLIGFIYFSQETTQLHNSFYYWRTTWSPSETELKIIEQTATTRIYLRVFDVDWSESQSEPKPLAPIQFIKNWPKNIEMIPVVFIKNRVFSKIKQSDISRFSRQVWNKVNQLIQTEYGEFKQIQIDCDWSQSTREKYFIFLQSIKELASEKKSELSVTIRLHQVKYPKQMGIPPMDRGMLMFYNMGTISAKSGPSSIYNKKTALLYTPWITKYPKPLDIVLPTFSWIVHTREGNILSLIGKIDERELKNDIHIKQDTKEFYSVLEPFFLDGNYFQKNDVIKIEKMDVENVKEAANLVRSSIALKNQLNSIAFFDLDEKNSDSTKIDMYKDIFKLFL